MKTISLFSWNNATVNICFRVDMVFYDVESLTFIYASRRETNVRNRLARRPCLPRIYITEMIFAAKLFHRVQSGAQR